MLDALFFIIFPLGEIIRLPFAGGVPLVDIGVLVVLLGFFVKKWREKKCGVFFHDLKKHPLFFPLCGFVGMCVISLLFQMGTLTLNQLLISSLYIVRWVSYSLLLFVAAEISFTRIKKHMLGGGILVIIFGYIQYMFYPDLRNLYYAGWDPHLYRMFGTFLDPNFMGAIIGLFIFLVLGLVLMHEMTRMKGVFLLLFSSVALLLTYSRSAFLMVLTGVVVMLLVRGYRKFIGGVFIVAVVSVVLLSMMSKYSEGTNLLRSVSTQARLGSSQQAWTLFQRSPITGVGFNAYRYAQDRYFPSCAKQNVSGCLDKHILAISHAGAGTDTSFLFVLATTGSIGFIAYLFLWYTILSLSWKKRTTPYGLVVFSSLSGLFVDSFFINSLFYPFVLVWIWVLVAQLSGN